MKTPITYYGGKQQLAETIIAMIPGHRIYCEPYFGGGAVFFAKGPSYLEAINDINDDLIVFYTELKNNFQSLFKMVDSTLCSESLWRKAQGIYKNGNGGKYTQTERAWAFWVVTNYSFSASPEGGWKWDNGTAGSHTGIVSSHARDIFTDKLKNRLRYVQISCHDAINEIKKRDTEETFFYLDPPYLNANQKHYRGFKEEDLEELLNKLENIKGRFILSHFKNGILDNYIRKNGWNLKIIDMPMRVSNFHGNSRRKQELLVYNYNLEPSLF